MFKLGAGPSVPRQKTPVPIEELAKTIADVFAEIEGVPPTQEQLTLLLSHSAFEIGDAQLISNYNVGHIVATGNDPYVFDEKTVEETSGIPGQKIKNKYKAYPDLKSGVRDYVQLIKKKYPDAWEAVKSAKPDPYHFSKGLLTGLEKSSDPKSKRTAKYYLAPPEVYSERLTNFYKKYNLPKYQQKIEKIIEEKNLSQPQLENFMAELEQLSEEPSNANEVEQLIKQFESAASDIPTYHALIKISSPDIVNNIEFANRLAFNLEQELSSNCSIHSNNNKVEINFSFPAPKYLAVQAAQEIIQKNINYFNNKIEDSPEYQINAKILLNKKSSITELTSAAINSNRRKFLLKFA